MPVVCKCVSSKLLHPPNGMSHSQPDPIHIYTRVCTIPGHQLHSRRADKALEAINVRCLQLHVQIHAGTQQALYVVSCWLSLSLSLSRSRTLASLCRHLSRSLHQIHMLSDCQSDCHSTEQDAKRSDN
jgi:hypothetical protein